MHRFRAPQPERGNPLWGAASAVLHLTLVIVLVSVAGPSYFTVPEPVFIALGGPGIPGPRERAMPVFGGVPSGVRDGGGGPALAVAVMAGTPRIEPGPPQAGIPRFYIEGAPGQTGESDSIAVPGMGLRRGGVLRPAYGDGRLWVRVAEAELGVVGPSADVVAHVARVDSAVRERIKAFIDTMPRDSFALPPPPRWTTEIDGNTWGIDPSWIYLGDIKIPTAILALLPLPSGNIDEAMDAQNLMRIRQEIIDAARRAENAAEFRYYVNELRARTDAERDARRAQRGDTIPNLP